MEGRRGWTALRKILLSVAVFAILMGCLAVVYPVVGEGLRPLIERLEASEDPATPRALSLLDIVGGAAVVLLMVVSVVVADGLA